VDEGATAGLIGWNVDDLGRCVVSPEVAGGQVVRGGVTREEGRGKIEGDKVRLLAVVVADDQILVGGAQSCEGQLNACVTWCAAEEDGASGCAAADLMAG
jgi:hypothetical protein